MFMGRDRRGWKRFLTFALVLSVTVAAVTRLIVPDGGWTASVVGWCLCGVGGAVWSIWEMNNGESA